MTKTHKYYRGIAESFLVLSLFSFTKSPKLYLSDFNSTKGDAIRSFSNKNEKNPKTYNVNEEYIYDSGRNGIIGQYAKWKVTSYMKHNAASNGFIISYDEPMLNPKTLTSYEFTISYTYSSSFSFAFQIQETHETSLKLATQFGFDDFINFSSAIGKSQSKTTIAGFTWTYASTVTKEKKYAFDVGRIPDGYLFSPCIVSNAVEIAYEYTVYDQYWWGDFESRDTSEVNHKNTLLVFDESTFEMTSCIKKEGQSGKPDYYLHA